MSWFKTGWEAAKEEGEKSPFENKGPRRLWLPPDKTVTLLFLDEDPTGMWEHAYQKNGEWGHFEPCKTKNKMDDRCPICDSGSKMFPHFINFFTVVNMTPWFTKKDNREMCYLREVFACRTGSRDKPGVMKKIERIRAEEGRLKGLVLRVYRSGAKTESCGDEFKVMEKVDPGQIDDYARTKMKDFVERVNKKLPGKDQVTVDKLLERNPWKAINFEKLFETDWKPKSLAELDRMFGRGGSAGGNDKDKESGGDADGGGSDEDIPY